MKPKMLHGGAWVSVANLRNKYFAAASPCSECGYLTAGAVWYNVFTNEVRCKKCFDPDTFDEPLTAREWLNRHRPA